MDTLHYDVAEVESASLRLQIEYRSPANYSLYLSGIPFIRALVVHNESNLALPRLDLQGTLSIDGRVEPIVWQQQIAGTIVPGAVTRLDHMADFAGLFDVLSSLRESAKGRLAITASSPVNGVEPVSLTANIEMNAANEFLNHPTLHAALVTFIQPNTSSITSVLRTASDLLLKETGDGALQGYQAGPDRARQIGAALYEALRARRLTYINPPASFEHTGQKVRPTEQVLTEQFGTCIDLAVLYAACLEAAGLYPLVFFAQGHAFGGFYTQEVYGESPTVSEINSITNLVDMGVIAPVELVGLNPGTDHTFQEALRIGREAFQQRLHQLRGMVDVARARFDGIKPMPGFAASDDPVRDAMAMAAERPFVARGSVDTGMGTISESVRGLMEANDPAPARVRNWKRDLLDLSLRNPLLNLPRSRKVLSLAVPPGMLAELDDIVHSGKIVRLAPADALDAIAVARGARSVGDLDPDEVHAALSRNRLVYTSAGEDLHVRQLRSMKREADTLEQETGSNYLYLTFGSLVHPKAGGGEAHAPLFLLPVRITGGMGRTPFSIRLDGDEIAQPNLCLLQWLRTTHGLELDELARPPIDDSGIAIQTVLESIRARLVSARLPYRIDELCTLSILRFATFQIWKDLDENWQHFLDNSVVQHLVERPGEVFVDPAAAATTAVDEATLRLPIPADGSQMAAVVRAVAGESFVLEGPPGTGKSQTIANLIAHALASGRTVLFVAEKQAALDVVRRRLGAIGVDAFTLELHGAKQSMKSIREQLRVALDVPPPTPAAGWDAADSKLRSAFEQLAHHRSAVHDRNAAAHSLWSSHEARSALGDGPAASLIPSHLTGTDGTTGIDIEAATEITREFQSAALQFGLDSHLHWSLAGPPSHQLLPAPDLQQDLENLSSALSQTVQLDQTWRAYLTDLLPDAGLQAVLTYADAVTQREAPASHDLPACLTATWEPTVRNLAEQVGSFHATHGAILADIHPAATLTLPLDDMIIQSRHLDDVRLFRDMRRKGLLEQVQHVTRPGVTIRGDDLTNLLTGLQGAVRDRSQLASAAAGIPGLVLPAGWDPATPEAEAQVLRALSVTQLGLWLYQQNPGLPGAIATMPTSTRLALQQTQAAWNSWLSHLGTSSDALRRWASRTPSWLETWSEDQPGWQRDLLVAGTLPIERFQRLSALADNLAATGPEAFANDLLTGRIPASEAVTSLLRGVAEASILERTANTGLDRFDADALDRIVESFQRESAEIRRMLPGRLAAAILQQRPFDPGQLRGEAAELKRQLDRKRGGLSFRELFQRYPRAITSLTPCFLMSPGSVSHYLDPEAFTFDLVIFDEASQIRVPQAIGSMGRGRSVVVVGDSRQMPPTRIMQVEASSADVANGSLEEVVVADLESILTEAVESGLPQEWLTWHYRSHDERLIAFSNQQYYLGRLVSLPSPGASISTGIEWRRVDGIFDRGKARTNEIEATAIVDEIATRLADPRTSDQSIGVVTFNIQQRDLILNKLEDSDNPLVVTALTQEDESSRLFVKNLENVQGDERDVILFSLAFSPDPSSGILPLNFGPLNSEGGERRLNVAVTRARSKVIVFSSFDAQHIDLGRTSARGVHDLRRYLEFAASNQATDVVDRPEQEASPVISEIAGALRARGWKVNTNLGMSTFQIDLAVRKPDDRFWRLAIMLDGPAWASRPTVTDRDGAPLALTTIMHWPAVKRVWLPAWRRNRQGEIERIERALEATPELREELSPPHPTPLESQVKENEAGASMATLAGERMAGLAPDATSHSRTTMTVTTFVPASDVALAHASVLQNMTMAAPAIQRYAEEILTIEGPTSLHRLVTIIGRRFGLGRLTADRRASLETAVQNHILITSEGAPFAWLRNVDPATWREIRRVDDSTARSFTDISVHELANAMAYLVDQSISMTPADLERETLTLLGYSRLTASARNWVGEGRKYALATERLTERNGRFESGPNG